MNKLVETSIIASPQDDNEAKGAITMDIQINAKYKIVSDPMNVILQEIKYPKPTEDKPNPEPRWEVVSYHADISQACNYLMKREGNLEETKTLTGFIKLMEDIKNEVVAACNSLKPQKEVA